MADPDFHEMPDYVHSVEAILDRRMVLIDIDALYAIAYAAKLRHQSVAGAATREAEAAGRCASRDPAVLSALADLDRAIDLFLWLHDVR